ncbi:MAG: alpha/beta fold hydrolase [Glaciihabitans sp.]|nr:alpha/beta fold hydrolase [Glaciihabitans sp.]
MGDEFMRKRSTPDTSAGKILMIGAIAAGGFLAFASLANAALVVAVARKVVTPPTKRVEDLRVLGVGDGTVTLSLSADSQLPGVYSLWFSQDAGHARIGQVVARDDRSVTRELLAVDSGDLATAVRARIGGWVFRTPASLGLAYENVTVPTPLGPAPAWLVPAVEETGRWMIAVHGRGVRRTEGLRAVEVFRDAGYTVLLVSYRNDGEAPPSGDGLYALGDTEWEDVDAALEFAVGHGARDIVLMGWSMGGATVLQTATRSPLAGAIRGIVLESPVVDWITVLTHQGRSLGLANPFRHGVLAMISGSWGGRLTGQLQPIDLRRLDFVERSAELTVPILLMHSADDDYVPVTASRALARLRPDIVTYDEFTIAGHTRLWNYDAQRWTASIAAWLRWLPATSARKGSSSHQPEAGSE